MQTNIYFFIIFLYNFLNLNSIHTASGAYTLTPLVQSSNTSIKKFPATINCCKNFYLKSATQNQKINSKIKRSKKTLKSSIMVLGTVCISYAVLTRHIVSSNPIFFSKNLVETKLNEHFAADRINQVSSTLIDQKNLHDYLLLNWTETELLSLISKKYETTSNFFDQQGIFFSAAIDKGYYKLALEIATQGNNPNDKNQDGFPQVILATKSNQPEILKALVNKGADINLENSQKASALHYAAYFGNVEIFNYLIKKGANPTHIDTEKSNILHYATLSKKDNSAMVELICKNNFIDINSIDSKNRSALQSAKFNNHKDVIKILKKYDAKELNYRMSTSLFLWRTYEIIHKITFLMCYFIAKKFLSIKKNILNDANIDALKEYYLYSS